MRLYQVGEPHQCERDCGFIDKFQQASSNNLVHSRIFPWKLDRYFVFVGSIRVLSSDEVLGEFDSQIQGDILSNPWSEVWLF